MDVQRRRPDHPPGERRGIDVEQRHFLDRFDLQPRRAAHVAVGFRADVGKIRVPGDRQLDGFFRGGWRFLCRSGLGLGWIGFAGLRLRLTIEHHALHLADLFDRQPAAQQIATGPQVFGRGLGGRVGSALVGRRVDVSLAQQRAVPIVGAAFENLGLEVDQRQRFGLGQRPQGLVDRPGQLGPADVGWDGGDDRNDPALEHQVDRFGHVGAIIFRLAAGRDVVGAQHQYGHLRLVLVEQLGQRRHTRLAAGEHFVAADAAASGVGPPSGQIDPGQPPAVSVVIVAGVHPAEQGHVVRRAARAVAGPGAVRIGVGDRVAQVQHDPGAAFRARGSGLHRGRIIPGLRLRSFLGGQTGGGGQRR